MINPCETYAAITLHSPDLHSTLMWRQATRLGWPSHPMVGIWQCGTPACSTKSASTIWKGGCAALTAPTKMLLALRVCSGRPPRNFYPLEATTSRWVENRYLLAGKQDFVLWSRLTSCPVSLGGAGPPFKQFDLAVCDSIQASYKRNTRADKG